MKIRLDNNGDDQSVSWVFVFVMTKISTCMTIEKGMIKCDKHVAKGGNDKDLSTASKKM